MFIFIFVLYASLALVMYVDDAVIKDKVLLKLCVRENFIFMTVKKQLYLLHVFQSFSILIIF